MLHHLKSYLQFLWNSSNEHGVHSPFVFQLVTQCFYDKKKYAEYTVLQQHRQSLLENQSTIQVTDFGAGSRVFKSNNRQVSAIAKNAGISVKRARLLFRLVQYLQPEKILEIGTSLGLATTALANGSKTAHITSLEGCLETLQVAKHYCLSPDTITFVNTEFTSYLPTLVSNQYDLIYFDGNHSKEATLLYFDTLLSTITNTSVWIFDDIHWSTDMEEAWAIIQQHPQVTVTIDTYQWGLVFFRREQAKEHFTIRV